MVGECQVGLDLEKDVIAQGTGLGRGGEVAFVETDRLVAMSESSMGCGEEIPTAEGIGVGFVAILEDRCRRLGERGEGVECACPV